MKLPAAFLLGLGMSCSINIIAEDASPINSEGHINKGSWIILIRKHGYSALTGTLIGALCGATSD